MSERGIRSQSAFRGRRDENEERNQKRTARESLYMRELLSAPAGRWLLGLILERGGIGMPAPCQCKATDYLDLGRRKAAEPIEELVVKYGSGEDIRELIYRKGESHGKPE